MLLDEPENYVDFLCKQKISANQFLLLYLLYTDPMTKTEKGLRYTKSGLIYKWSNEGKGWTKEEVKDLVDKEYVISLSPDYAFDQLVLTNKFADLMFIDSNDAFEEILKLYPESIKIQGNVVFTKTVDLDLMAKLYAKAIKRSVKKHEEVKNLLKIAVEKGLINTKIDKFIQGKVWESIKNMDLENSRQYGKDIY